ncbi:PDR/VanB family oxidoreductase [Caballeronia sp. LZ062]|uniref:PDR/VanB family oxidoreductase n=1 Tax=unclassified Caballeronia TaxID=2646786 RepID=UPI002864C9D7|nr:MULTISPECIES: PDR/VanB family oxidoreductase [unclassified Caballeronia]MDR5857753.1 PDR/VanB family oxidoreductase [Caballeronia sp. LZ050]MDR5869303.1 PDR/VanB family oxidoreductase [Caballeronia sp. LZ062]
MSNSPSMTALVRTLRHEAPGIMSIELVPPRGERFPGFEPGAHIDLHLSSGLLRSYSLLNPCGETDRYVVGVQIDKKGRGGSRFIHDNFRVGMSVQLSAPRNLFSLDENAGHSVLIAGGIGVTPILCMYRRLIELGRPVQMLYCARSAEHAAFIDELRALGGKLDVHFDDENDRRPADLKAYLSQVPADAHVYCCGPAPMLDAFDAACEAVGITNRHIERFQAVPQAAPALNHGYSVELARSKKLIDVAPGATLLDSLLEAGVEVEHSCMEGICGSCETRVLGGCPDHRDSVLSASERATNQVMMVCVSGCKGEKLVLDL